MEEVDIENADADELNELEARLYAQIHHGPAGEGEGDASANVFIEHPQRVVTLKTVINNKSPVLATPSTARYWSEGNAQISKDEKSINRQQISNDQSSTTTETSGKSTASNKQIETVQPNDEKAGSTEATEISEKPQTNAKCENSINIGTNAGLDSTNFQYHSKEKEKIIRGVKHSPVHQNVSRQKGTIKKDFKSNFLRQNLPIIHRGPFGMQLNKLQHAVQLQNKRSKSQQVKEKKTVQVSTIDLNSSDEDDDVIEVPLPTPPTYTVIDSSDEENGSPQINDVDKDSKENFAKPHESSPRKTNEQIQENIRSGCTSPCSVLSSDDFIGHSDRAGLSATTLMADDEDILLLQVDVDSMMDDITAPSSEKRKLSVEENSLFLEPSNDPKSNPSCSSYRVTQPQFRALDVYESESDIQETVYTKGTLSNKKQTNQSVEITSSSSDVEEIIDLMQKTKRLRKRRASSIRDPDMNNASSDSSVQCQDIDENGDAVGVNDDDDDDDLYESRKGVTGIPFIVRGEAVERRKPNNSRRNQRNVQMSDNEFLATLNTLAQGKNSNATTQETSGGEEQSDEEITARAIAEKVLNSTITSTSAGVVTEQSIETNSTSDAVPDNLEGLDEVFKQIDDLDSKGNADNDSGSLSEVEIIAPRPRQISSEKKNKRKLEHGDRVYNVVYCEEDNYNNGIGWNDEMRRFYNCSWNGEQFNANEVRKKMNPLRTLWKIYSEDRFPRACKNSRLKCNNCCEFGHIRAKCRQPKRPLKCYMCGQQGHREPRCPNTVCLRCGNKTRVFTKSCSACTFQNRIICPLCKLRGHTINYCPDKWRRYHSTTEPNAYPNNTIEYNKRKFCCVCASRGHLSETCKNAIRFLEYPLATSDIKSHQKSYNDLALKTIQSGIAFNLLYNPEEDVSFELAENKNQTHYYGRFLNAVGLGHLLNRKQMNISNQSPGKKKPKSLGLTKYVVNPFAKAALSTSANVSNTSSDRAIQEPQEGLEEISAIEPIENVCTGQQIMDVDEVVECAEADSTQTESVQNITKDNQFKTPNTQNPRNRTQNELSEIDSDSNYSFSEHYKATEEEEEEVEDEEEREEEEENRAGGSQDTEALPDFIPLRDSFEPDENDAMFVSLEGDERFGISQRYVYKDHYSTDNNDTDRLLDLPCEAKIYLTHFHSKFLLSEEGKAFLDEKSKRFNIKARLDMTSVGHILIIFGLKSNQDKFHTELLFIFRSLTDNETKTKKRQLESVWNAPRKVDALIRYIRTNINQLLTNLGKPQDLWKELKDFENRFSKYCSKTAFKNFEKTRSILNMILIGQAGLHEGHMHLDSLILILKSLINDYASGQYVSDHLRKKVDHHCKYIFSSYNHDNYEELLAQYNTMFNKNRIPNLNIDVRLLVEPIKTATTPTTSKNSANENNDNTDEINNLIQKSDDKNSNRPQQSGRLNKEKLQKQTAEKSSPIVVNPMCMNNSRRNKQTNNSEYQRQRTQSFTNRNQSNFNANKQQQQHQQQQNYTQYNNNMQQNTSSSSNQYTCSDNMWENPCDNLLPSIDNCENANAPNRNCRERSMFWSNESMKFINNCIQIARQNRGLMNKLLRVKKKSQNGDLSYNDYRAVIKIHNALTGKIN